jgi:hypothetical protein
MVRRISSLTLSLVAIAALLGSAAIATASAAEPIFERVIVIPVKEGEKITFKGVGSKVTLETVEKSKVTCTSTASTGAVSGPNGVTMAITLKGCESSASKCTSAGAAEGEIVTNTFEGKLGNLKSGSTPGVALFQSKEKTTDAEFTCGTNKVKLTGGVVGTIGLDERVETKLTLLYTAKAGIQLFESLFGGTLDVLDTQFNEGAATQSGLSTRITITLAEPLEVS